MGGLPSMKLIVFRTIDDREKYQDLLMDGTVWKRRGPSVLHYIENTVCYICADDDFGLKFLRGYQFDEVLWVGYEDRYDVGFKAPMELLAQTHEAKYHYCKPPEPQKAPSKPSYKFTLPQGFTIDKKAQKRAYDGIAEHWKEVTDKINDKEEVLVYEYWRKK